MALLSEVVGNLRTQIQEWREHPDPVWGLPTGLPALDRKLGGLQPDTLYLIAARPSMGKSCLAGQIAFDVARYFKENEEGTLAVVFSAEMKKGSMVLREVSRQTAIDGQRIRAGEITVGEYDRIQRVLEQLETLPIYVQDDYGLATEEAEQIVLGLEEQFGARVGFVVYDYIQLAHDAGANDKVRVAAAIETLKRIARTGMIPVVVVSQLNREIEKRQFGKDLEAEDREPKLSDLKDAGALEEKSDCIMFIHLPGRAKQISEGREDELSSGKLIIAKNREGRTGPVWVTFDPIRTAFIPSETQ